MKTPIGSILLALLVLPVAGCGMSDKEMKATIHKACADGDLATVRKLLDEDPSLKDFKEKNRGRTPLFSAGSREVAELLVDKGADVNQQDRFRWTPLHTAADADIAEFLISKGADPASAAMKDLTPLHTAVSGEVAQVLINNGANAAVEKDPRGREGPRTTPLYWAIHKRRADVVEVLLDNGANIHEEMTGKKTLLHFAASRPNYVDVAEVLVNHGLSVDDIDRYDATPLHYAAMQDSLDMAQWLIDNGADVNAQLSPHAAIYKFSTSGGPGPGPAPVNAGNKTPLGIAESKEMKDLLKENGAE